MKSLQEIVLKQNIVENKNLSKMILENLPTARISPSFFNFQIKKNENNMLQLIKDNYEKKYFDESLNFLLQNKANIENPPVLGNSFNLLRNFDL